MQERRIASVDEMFDLLATMPNGKFATICYVNAVQIYKTKKSVDMDRFGSDLDSNKPEGEDSVYNSLRQYHDDEKVKKMPFGVVSVTRYTLNWSSEENHNKHYAEYASQKDEIDKKWGIYKAPEDRRQGGFDAVNTFGTSLGTTDNTRNRSYIHQNTAKARMKSDLYAIDGEGNMLGEINPSYIKSLRTPGYDSAAKALRELGRSEEEIKQYQKEIADLNFTHRKFLVEKILYIIATIDGDKFVYINDSLAANIDVKSKMVIKPDQFIALANKLYREDDNMVESYNHKLTAIRESVMKQITNQIDISKLDESVSRRIIENACSRIMCEFDEGEYGYDDLDDEEEEVEIDPFEEYQQNYPNSDFQPDSMDTDKLARWCNTHSFAYVIPNIFSGQLHLRWADEHRLNCEMAYRIYNSEGIEHTHDADYYIERPLKNEFEDNYVAVYNVKGFIGDEGKPVKCYIVYATPKDEYDVTESRLQEWGDSLSPAQRTYVAGAVDWHGKNAGTKNTGKNYLKQNYNFDIEDENFHPKDLDKHNNSRHQDKLHGNGGSNGAPNAHELYYQGAKDAERKDNAQERMRDTRQLYKNGQGSREDYTKEKSNFFNRQDRMNDTFQAAKNYSNFKTVY